MGRITFIAFIMLSGFFYVTGKPVDKAELQISGAAGVVPPGFATGRAVKTAHVSLQDEKRAKTPAPSLAPVLIRAVTPVKNAELQYKGGGLQVPSRNPKRRNFVPSQIITTAMVAPRNTAPKSRTEIAFLKKPVKNLTFEDVKSRSTSAAVKPLMVSYQKRYVKEKNPVLGPRLTAILLKRELRRVGCYEGAITSSWNDNARSAVENFNINSNGKLTVKTPTAIALEQVQQTTKIVCVKKAPVARTIVANVPAAVATTLAAKKASQWTTKLQRSKRSTQNSTFSGEATDILPLQAVPATQNYVRRVRKTRVKRRNYRAIAKRVRKTRYARRTARRRTAVRSWKRTYRRKRFGFRRSGMEFSIGN